MRTSYCGKQVQGELLARLDNQLSHNRVWQSGINAAFEDAVDGWRQAYALHIRVIRYIRS